MSVSRLAEIAAVLEVLIAWFFRNLQSPVQPGALDLHQQTQARMYAGAGQHRIHGPTSEAITGIGILLREQRRQRSGRFASRPLDLATLRAFPSLQQLLDAYCASEASTDLLQRQELLANVLQRRFLIVERVDRNDTLLIRAIGAGYRAFDRRWSKKSAGTRLDEQPDVEYGTWLSSGYLGVLAGKQAQAEEVDAIIYGPRYGRRRYTYRRLMLPFATADGRELVLSASIPDTSIDIGLDQDAKRRRPSIGSI